MLIVRDAQLAAFDRDADARLADALAADFARRDPAAAERIGAALRERVLYAVARARGHALDRRVDVASFVELALRIGPRFDEHPAIRAVLADSGVPPELRVPVAIETVPAEAWAAAAALPAE